MRAGVRDDERRGRACGDVEEARFREERAVDEDPELVALVDELVSAVGESRAIRPGRVAELDAVAVVVRAAPDEAEGAEPALVPVVQVAGEWLGALEMNDRPLLFTGDASLEIVDSAHDREVALGD